MLPITERILTRNDFERYGISDPHFKKEFWACTLISNKESQWPQEGIVLMSDCGTIKIKDVEDLKEFTRFDRWIKLIRV
jgi:hypothetical protein